jgi:hypothetical protein
VANLNWRPERTAHLLEHQAEITVSQDMAHDRFNINDPEFTSLDAHSFLIAASAAASAVASRAASALNSQVRSAVNSPDQSVIEVLEQNQTKEAEIFVDAIKAETENVENKKRTKHNFIPMHELMPFRRHDGGRIEKET